MSVQPLETLDPTPPRGLQLLPAPDCEPPYDDERPGGRPLPLRPHPWPGRRSLRLVPDLEEPEPRTPTCELPAAGPFAQALVIRLLEVLAGVRPLAQLQPDSTLAVYDGLQELLRSRPRRTGRRPDRRDLRSVHVQQQADGVAEVTATVRRGDRYAALALRLEGSRGRWRCTELVGA